MAEPGDALRRRAGGIEESHRGHPIDDPEVPLGVQLFAADGVTWVVCLPTGLALDTMWPDMDWIEALGPVNGEVSAQTLEEAAS